MFEGGHLEWGMRDVAGCGEGRIARVRLGLG